MKNILFIIGLFIGITSYTQENSTMKTSLKFDSIEQMMKSSHPDLWKKYRTGHFFKYNIGASYVSSGGLVLVCGLCVNLSTDSKKQTAEVIANQKKIGNNLMKAGGTVAIVAIIASIIGAHKQKVAIRGYMQRTQNRQAELQLGIMSSGELGLALKF
jgi:hypothetical protein